MSQINTLCRCKRPAKITAQTRNQVTSGPTINENKNSTPPAGTVPAARPPRQNDGPGWYLRCGSGIRTSMLWWADGRFTEMVFFGRVYFFLTRAHVAVEIPIHTKTREEVLKEFAEAYDARFFQTLSAQYFK